MYFDPTWIFEEKPPVHDYPNMTGLLGDDPPKRRRRKEPTQQPIESMSDVFNAIPYTKRSKAPQVFPTTGMEGRDAQISQITPIKPPQQPINSFTEIIEREYDPIPSLQEREIQRFKGPIESIFKMNERNLRTKRYGVNENPAIKARYYGKDIQPGALNTPTPEGFIRLKDDKYNIRNNLAVSTEAINEIKKYAQAGGLTPEQTIILAAISANEGDFGSTNSLFGINDLYQDFPNGLNYMPDSYEAKQINSRYSGDIYHDVIGWINRKTDNFNNIENYNRNFSKDRNVNPRGESYSDRINRNKEILLNNPQFMEALLGENWQELLNTTAQK